MNMREKTDRILHCRSTSRGRKLIDQARSGYVTGDDTDTLLWWAQQALGPVTRQNLFERFEIVNVLADRVDQLNGDQKKPPLKWVSQYLSKPLRK